MTNLVRADFEKQAECLLLSAKLVELSKSDPLPLEEIKSNADQLLELLKPAVQKTGQQTSSTYPDLSARITARMKESSSSLNPEAEILIYKKETSEEISELWKKQLRDTLKSVHGLLSDDKAIVKDWMMAWVEAKPGIDLFFRAEHAQDYLKEAQKLCLLLKSKPKIFQVTPKSTLFADDFSSLSDQWKVFGKGEVKAENKQLHLNGNGISVFCMKPFDNALISFDFKPIASEGIGSGCLFAFPAIPLTPNGYESSSGPMVDYNYGIETYHVSLYRGTTGCSNLRKTGRGLRMLSTVIPDPCAQLGKTYHVEILRSQSTIQIYVDEKLIHSYLDGGVYGTPLEKGCFGIRLFSGSNMEATLANFQVSKLERSPANP